MNMHMNLPATGQVDLSCPIETEPAGGLERLRAAEIQLTDEEIALCRAAAASSAPAGMATFFAYPVAVELLTSGRRNVNLIGRCPHCGLLHNHGLSADMRRVPNCPEGVPPFVNGKAKPDTYRVVPVLDRLPDEFNVEVLTPKDDLLTFARIAFGSVEQVQSYSGRMLWLREAQRVVRKRSSAWTVSAWSVAFVAIVRAGVLATRERELMSAGITLEDARRTALAQYLRAHGGARGPGPNNRWRVRVGRALMAAHREVSRAPDMDPTR